MSALQPSRCHMVNWVNGEIHTLDPSPLSTRALCQPWTSALGIGPTPKRRRRWGRDSVKRHRKIRKGTRSCWACKRRKVRCSFPSAQSQACVHCQRRGSQCVGQDVLEELAPADSSDSERIVAVESLAHSSGPARVRLREREY